MKLDFPFSKADLLPLKKPALICAGTIAMAGLVYFGANYLDQRARRDVQNAQINYDQTALSVEQIASEEATIVRYIDRYRMLEADGVMADENRLEVLETMASLRLENKLYPVSLNMDEQLAVRLQYDPADPAPGDPVDLRSTEISLQWTLLHEGDFLGLMTGLEASPGLYQVRQCKISNIAAQARFDVLAENLAADCQVLRYGFDLDPVITEEFF